MRLCWHNFIFSMTECMTFGVVFRLTALQPLQEFGVSFGMASKLAALHAVQGSCASF